MITGTRVVLTPKTLADARRDYLWQKDAELMSLSGRPALLCSFIEYITRYAGGYYHQNVIRQFAIKALADGCHFGNCAIYDIEPEFGEAQIGIIIGDKEFLNKHYGRDAVMALIGYMFSEMKMNRIFLKTLEENIRAQRCFANCGFRTCGSTLLGGRYYLIMELHRQDYINAGLASTGNGQP
jgi:[ribosomal protein S5]-alanine N-acetyltransferase